MRDREGNDESRDERLSPDPDTEERKLLVSLLTRHQRQLFAYIYTLVADFNFAEDLVQETNLVVCEKFREFEPGTDFLAWACQIAWWRVRAARQRLARSRLLFDDDVLQAVAATAAQSGPELDRAHEILRGCLDKLHPRDRQTVLARYEPGSGVAEAARQSGRSVGATYKALFRIRKALFDCVSLRLPALGENG